MLRVLGLSRGRLRRSPIVADQPDAILQRCDLIALAVPEILAACFDVAAVAGDGILAELAEKTPAPVSVLFDGRGACTAPAQGQLLELRRADVRHTSGNMICARCEAEAAESPLVPALSALVPGLTLVAAE